MKKSASEEALNAFSRGESSLGADGALVFDKVGYQLPSSEKWLVKDITGYVVSSSVHSRHDRPIGKSRFPAGLYDGRSSNI